MAYECIGIVLHHVADGARSMTYKLYGYSRRDSLQGMARTATVTDDKPPSKAGMHYRLFFCLYDPSRVTSLFYPQAGGHRECM